jgi:F420-0:gamma-glutamyl ligase
MAVTEIVLTGGERLRIDGDVTVVESAIVSAARGSIMELAWMVEAQTGDRVGINPDHVVTVRELDVDIPSA